MSLRVWLPLNGSLKNQGLDKVTVTNNGATVDNNGKIGKCYYFDGSNDYITVQDVNLPNVWSYSCWLYSEVSSRSWEVVMTCNINGGDADMQLGLYTRPSGNNIQNTANGQYNASIPMTYGQWNHFVGTFDGSNLKTYLNGILVNTKAITNTKLDRPKLTIGARCRGSNYDCYFKGKLNDIRIYDHALSPLEVKRISQGLILHYPLDRNGWGNENLLSRYVVPGQAAPTSTAAGGRTTWLGDYKITIPATQNADTYFRLFTTKQLTANATYTISCKVDGLLSGSYYRFPLYAQGNTAMGILNLDHNGLCSLTFTMTYGTQTAVTGANGETVYICFMDDSARAIVSGQGAITISNFKLEEGDKVTPWCPNSTDSLATLVGMNSTIVKDISGYQNNGELIGTFSYTTDTPKYNVSTYAQGGASTYLKGVVLPSEAKTVSLWIKTPKNASSAIFNDKTTGLQIGLLNSLLYANSLASTTPFTTTHWTNDGWNHVVVINNNGIRSCYINGEAETQSGSNNYYIHNANEFWVWNRSYNNNYPFTGSLSDLRIYSTALSADEVKELYENNIVN